MARRQSSQADPPGQDSFLDVVANLVGIMIILIIVVGAATKKALVDAGPTVAALPGESSDDDEPPAELKQHVHELGQEIATLENDLDQTDQKLKRQQFEISFRRGERNELLTVLTAAERNLEEKRGTLDASQREQLDLTAQTASARQALAELERAKAAAENSAATVGVIEHLPTPMAKTVFGKELHFRLLGKRITYVPWDELVEKLKADAPQRVWKLRDNAKSTETIGPIENFWMKYTLKRAESRSQTSAGMVVQTRVELDRFVMIPVSEDLGEPVEQALRPGSEFMSRLEGANPNRTTVTVWTYPDSFNDFRAVKQALFKKGLLCAARPLPDGHPLGGSPEGTRSSAQ